MIPLKDNIPTGRFPFVTAALVAINVIAYLLAIRHGGSVISGPSELEVFKYGAIPYALTHPGVHCAEVVRQTLSGQGSPMVLCNTAELHASHIAAQNRDPKVAWFAPEKKWVMALYLDHNDYAIFESHDLKQWTKLQDFTLPGDSECPNFFQVPLDGDVNNPRWVFFGASGVYVVGKFDGHQFTPESRPQVSSRAF